MKKNRLFVLGLVTVFVALVSLTFVSSTWAKYTTTASGSDTARVAYWGFGQDGANELVIDDLFANAYDGTIDPSTKSVVSADSTEDVIAPGTSGQANFQFQHKDGVAEAPEVKYTFTVSTTGSECATEIKNNGNIQWSLDGGAWGTWDQLIASIKLLSGEADGSKVYNAGEVPVGFGDSVTHTISWQWLFSENPAGDVDDTTLGNLSARTVTIAIAITAEQVD